METYSVYITLNLLNNKAYVGMTNGHRRNYLGSSPTLKKDIKKLGIKNFSKTILGTFNNWEECHYWEGFYIRTLQTHISEGGYNEYRDGGNYLIQTEELKEKNRQKHLGKKNTEESKKKNRIAAKQWHETIGFSELNKKNISNSMKIVPKIICPYNGKSYSPWTYARWVRDRYKNNKNI
jgi:hypothetical protein